MVVCIVALIVLAFMAIFSAKYRGWFGEALSCVTRRLVLKPCVTGFDQKVKAVVTAKLLQRNRRLARFTHRHFEAISWVFMIVFAVSIVLTAQGLYNVVFYGSCDPHSDNFCIFSPVTGVSCGSQHCSEKGCACGPKDTNCTLENNYTACEGNCTCNITICG